MEFFIGWIACVLVGALIGKYRGRTDSGVILAALLGPIGWLAVALMDDKRPKCIECGGVVVEGARKCLHCGSAIERMFDIRCPACGERGKVREACMSEQIECPKCRTVFPATSERSMSSSSSASPQPAKGYYFSTDGKQQGPVPASDLRSMRKDGLIADDTPILREGETQWRRFQDFLALTR
jgi:hypothetical protein